MTIRVLVADDHPLLRAGLAAVIGAEPDLALAGEAADGAEAVALFRGLAPDVTLLDLRMPGTGGLGALRAIRALDPGARVVILTTYQGDEDIRQAFAAGAAGYLLKDMLRREVVNAIRAVHHGQRFVPAPVAARLLAHLPLRDLTTREREVLQLALDGLGNRAIAERLGRSEGTIKIHMKHILAKLDASDRTQAVVAALRRGILHLD